MFIFRYVSRYLCSLSFMTEKKKRLYYKKDWFLQESTTSVHNKCLHIGHCEIRCFSHSETCGEIRRNQNGLIFSFVERQNYTNSHVALVARWLLWKFFTPKTKQFFSYHNSHDKIHTPHLIAKFTQFSHVKTHTFLFQTFSNTKNFN